MYFHNLVSWFIISETNNFNCITERIPESQTTLEILWLKWSISYTKLPIGNAMTLLTHKIIASGYNTFQTILAISF